MKFPSLPWPIRRRVPARPEMWPDAITVSANRILCGTTMSATLLVAGLPPEVAPGWLDTLTTMPGVGSVSMHITPVTQEKASTSLKRRRARLEASRRHAFKNARLDDPAVEAAAADSADLAARLATGDTRLFTIGVYLIAHGRTGPELAETVAHVRSHAAAAGLSVRVASFRQLQGLTSVLPFGIDAVATTTTVDTDTVAASYPFTTADTSGETGVLMGTNLTSGAPVLWDRFTQPNHNQVLLARSGAGKSFLTKTEIARSVMTGIGVTVIDPDGEYIPLAEHLGGTVINVGAAKVAMNPLELPPAAEADALTRRIMFCHTVAATALGCDLEPDEAAAFDSALLAAYATAGITLDPATWDRSAPRLSDVCRHLSTADDPAAKRLAVRLGPFVAGSFNRLFNAAGKTSTPAGHLVVFNLAGLPEELTAIATVLVLDAAWRRATGPDRHLVFVDEAWRLLSTSAGAGFLSRLAKSARKHRAGLSVVTQDAADVLASDLGRVVVANAATQLLMAQAPQALPAVTEAFGLSRAEVGFLATAQTGEALLLGGSTHVAFASTAAEMPHTLLVTGEAAAS